MPLIINAPLPASASSSGFEQVADLGAEAKALRAAVRSGAPETRAKSQGYADLKSQVEKQKTAVLLPLQAAMATAAPSAGLTADNQKRLELLPLLMKGHLLELDQALAESKFDEYVSKTTKATYTGGKVERELEEIEETADEFLELIGIKP